MRFTMMRWIALAGFLASVAACKPLTQFVGDAHYPGGPDGCRQNCASNGMEMSAFVYSGEFATSCVCRARSTAPAPAPAAPAQPASVGTSTTDADEGSQAAVGVAEQARRVDEEQQRQREQDGQRGQ